ncbi:MAG TPA: ECF transporter S component [Armatimonadota bacterium]|nr:ECF transporter S component [Armatimonadota bacterium]
MNQGPYSRITKLRPGGRTKLLPIFGAILGVAACMALSTLTQKHAAFNIAAWAAWGIGAVAAIVIYAAASAHSACRVGTREVVMMAIGAALYGILASSTNWMTISGVSPVSLRPAIAIPVLFGSLFGPVVGFFTGAVGNILGDFISGIGVYPAWDLGNGLVGLVAGLSIIYVNRSRAINVATAIAVLTAAAAGAWMALQSRLVFENPITGHTVNHHPFWWVLTLGAAVLIAVRLGFRRKPELLSPVIWGVLGVIIGLGFASVADIWINGFTPVVALVGEFAPSAGPDVLMIIVLVPLLYSAYQNAVARSGR